MGALVGLLLTCYGAASLWTGRLALSARASLDNPTALDSGPTRTLPQAQRDLIASPASAYRWIELADAQVNANKLDLARFSIRQALSGAPGNPAILFRAANLYLRLEDYDQTLAQLTSVLRNPDLAPYYERVFTLYSQMDLPFRDLLNRGLPHTPQAADAFLRFWIKQGKAEEADEAWQWISSQSLGTLQSAGSYAGLLARQSRWDEAGRVWSEYGASHDPDYRKSNFIYNGSFERPIVDSPFDWRLQPSPKVEVARDTQTGDHGHASLRLDFSGTPAEHVIPAFQTVMLEAGTWELKARMKTHKLTSSQGVVIRVSDPKSPESQSFETNSIEGTEDWTTVSTRFEVKAGMRIARVEIVRPLSRQFDSRLTGIAWIDAVMLRPLPKAISFKPTRLRQTSQPCENHGNCGVGQPTSQSTSQ